ncbi:hypothetical protein ACGFYV_05670 [Streptomyces sp. NPDC048297]|uniref:hypothetical protein n=1 Tax=Streptomyces sp. NPDC048297 TaxID=3365531 RepID=UPI00371FC66C
MTRMTGHQREAVVEGFAKIAPATVLWAALIAAAPWLPAAVGMVDLTGVTVMLSMLLCSVVPSSLLGVFLGRARACWAVAACGVVGPVLWLLDVTVFGDPDVHSPDDAGALFFTGLLALGLISAPLMAGAAAGWSCGRSGTTH